MKVVPQYVDVEDRIAGPLTWKHIGFLVPIFGALAFAKPAGVTMVEFLGYGIHFIFRPRLYTWQREVQKTPQKQKTKEMKITAVKKEKDITTDDVSAIARTLDSRGVERNARLQKLMKERLAQKNKK
ncbi:MAG: hypothetical protein CR972_05370 [Candidatus Moraniibacteriota bacterium]|nr:MAG: hypothetical protein CR972_05370 [Candidatus Moranbacteria bacterium]